MQCTNKPSKAANSKFTGAFEATDRLNATRARSVSVFHQRSIVHTSKTMPMVPRQKHLVTLLHWLLRSVLRSYYLQFCGT
jgi:hypothetical protein